MYRDKVVWITGASSGIGLAFAEALHEKGAKLILSALTEKELEPVIKKLFGSIPIAFDVADFDSLPKIVEQAKSAFSKIDILINNAGITQRELAINTSFDVYRRLIDIDLMAPIALTQLVMPDMLERGSGKIIVTASVAGKFGSPLRSAYCAAKHGLFGHFDSLRCEVEHLGVDIHMVAPGAVKTNLARNAVTGDGEKFGKTDAFIEGGYDPAHLVNLTLDQVAKGKREIIIARGPEKLGYQMHRFFPEFFHKFIGKRSPDMIKQFEESR